MYGVYGAGVWGRRFIEKLYRNGFSIYDLFVMDSDPRKTGASICGITIQQPSEQLLNENVERIIVTVQNDDQFNEIAHTLCEKYQLDKRLIIHVNDAVVIPDTPNVGNMGWSSSNGHRIASLTEFRDELRRDLDEDQLNDLERFYFYSDHRGMIKDLHYFQAYNTFFEKYRHKPEIKILEIGVGDGGSLQMWKSYFSKFGAKVRIYGLDVVEKCKEYEEENISIFIGSQENRAFLKSVKETIGQVDIIIDDGGHTMNQQIVSFEELFESVLPGGVYLCEDTATSYMEPYGGGYQKKTFIEYSKGLIDGFYRDYIDEVTYLAFSPFIRSISYYSGMVFIEKNPSGDKSLTLTIK